MSKIFKLLGCGLSAALTVATMMVGISAASPAHQGAAARTADAGGSLHLTSSTEATALFDSLELAPGEAQRATTTVANSGDAPGQFWLSIAGLSDSPGPGGGALSRRLELTVDDVTRPGQPVTQYLGSVGSMPVLALGRLRPGTARTYRFTVRFRDGGASTSASSRDNAYQGSSLGVGFVWSGE